jgi:hypothetical protein
MNQPLQLANSLRIVLASAICMALVAGCCPPPPPDKEHALNPPALLPTAAVIAQINANNQKLPTLWASLNYSVTMIDDQGKPHSVTSDDGTLLFAQPVFFRLNGSKEFVGTVFDIGANDSEFWCEVVPGLNILYRGSFAELQQMGPNTKLPIPIRPELIRDVLGIGIIGPNLLATPAPIMRFDPASDSYVILFASQTTDHWVSQKQIWYDRKTIRPRRVVVYAEEGRPVLDAELAHDLRVSVPNVPPDSWPMVVADYRLFFPDNGSHMEFSLKDVMLFKEGRHGVPIPSRSNFDVPDVSGTDIHTHFLTSSRVD